MEPSFNILSDKKLSPTTRIEHPDLDVQSCSNGIIRAFNEKIGKVFLLYGEDAVFQLSLQMAAHAIANGKSVAVVDGCNRFDVHAITRFARIRKINPSKLLNRIFISRGFTCYQIEQAIVQKLPTFLSKLNSNTALIFGLLDTLYDEQVSLHEAQQILRRILASFQKMKSNGISLLLVCLERNIAPKERNNLFYTLKQGADRVYKLSLDNHQAPRLHLEYTRTTLNNTKGVIKNGKNCTNLHKLNRCRVR